VLYASSPTCIRCNLTGNSVESFGGGLLITDSSIPIFIDSQIDGNNSPNGGGGAFIR
jgi:hypothetical protein